MEVSLYNIIYVPTTHLRIRPQQTLDRILYVEYYPLSIPHSTSMRPPATLWTAYSITDIPLEGSGHQQSSRSHTLY